MLSSGCENCNGPHLTRDCDLDENGNQKVQACYSSDDHYDEDWRKNKKTWLPYDEYNKSKEEKFEQKGKGFYQRKEPAPEKKPDFESMLARFAAALEKRHDETEAAIREQQALMTYQQTLLRNQQASILNIEKTTWAIS